MHSYFEKPPQDSGRRENMDGQSCISDKRKGTQHEEQHRINRNARCREKHDRSCPCQKSGLSFYGFGYCDPAADRKTVA